MEIIPKTEETALHHYGTTIILLLYCGTWQCPSIEQIMNCAIYIVIASTYNRMISYPIQYTYTCTQWHGKHISNPKQNI
jgi:hypothetical protein